MCPSPLELGWSRSPLTPHLEKKQRSEKWIDKDGLKDSTRLLGDTDAPKTVNSAAFDALLVGRDQRDRLFREGETIEDKNTLITAVLITTNKEKQCDTKVHIDKQSVKK